MAEMILQLIVILAPQVFRVESDKDGDEEVCTSAKMYLMSVEAIEIGMHLNLWKILEGYPPRQTFSPHIQYHLSTYFGKEDCST